MNPLFKKKLKNIKKFINLSHEHPNVYDSIQVSRKKEKIRVPCKEKIFKLQP
jgi:hypothetical protein